MLGSRKRETHGMDRNSNHTEMLLKAEEKQRNAMRKDREAEELNRSAFEGERNVHILCDQLLDQGRTRSEIEREKEKEESKVSTLAEKLNTYKIEIANCEYLSRKLIDEEGRLDQECNRLNEEAEVAEHAALVAEQEANKIESELYNH